MDFTAIVKTPVSSKLIPVKSTLSTMPACLQRLLVHLRLIVACLVMIEHRHEAGISFHICKLAHLSPFREQGNQVAGKTLDTCSFRLGKQTVLSLPPLLDLDRLLAQAEWHVSSCQPHI